MSIDNFVRLADPKMILSKQIEIKVSNLFPPAYCSRYRAVFYGDYTYKEAKDISDKNE